MPRPTFITSTLIVIVSPAVADSGTTACCTIRSGGWIGTWTATSSVASEVDKVQVYDRPPATGGHRYRNWGPTSAGSGMSAATAPENESTGRPRSVLTPQLSVQ